MNTFYVRAVSALQRIISLGRTASFSVLSTESKYDLF